MLKFRLYSKGMVFTTIPLLLQSLFSLNRFLLLPKTEVQGFRRLNSSHLMLNALSCYNLYSRQKDNVMIKGQGAVMEVIFIKGDFYGDL